MNAEQASKLFNRRRAGRRIVLVEAHDESSRLSPRWRFGLLSYTIGKPGPAVDPDTLDQQEWRLHRESAVPPKEADELLTAVPAAAANLIAQFGWPCQSG